MGLTVGTRETRMALFVPPMATAHGNPSGVTSSRRVSTGRNSPSGRESRPTERGRAAGAWSLTPTARVHQTPDGESNRGPFPWTQIRKEPHNAPHGLQKRPRMKRPLVRLRANGRNQPPIFRALPASSMASALLILDRTRPAHGLHEPARHPVSLDPIGPAEQDPVSSHCKCRSASERRHASVRQGLGRLLGLAGRP